MSRMLSVIREHGSRTQREHAYCYAARGNVIAIEAIYRKVIGQWKGFEHA